MVTDVTDEWPAYCIVNNVICEYTVYQSCTVGSYLAGSGDFWVQAHTIYCVNKIISHFVFIWIKEINIEVSTDKNSFMTLICEHFLHPFLEQINI